MAFVFQREHNSYGTCSALSPFDFNSASFFTLRLSVYPSYRDRAEEGTRRKASAPAPPLLTETCPAKHAPILPPAQLAEAYPFVNSPSPLAQKCFAQALSSKPSFACIKLNSSMD